jgi:hypothetical protein
MKAHRQLRVSLALASEGERDTFAIRLMLKYQEISPASCYSLVFRLSSFQYLARYRHPASTLSPIHLSSLNSLPHLFALSTLVQTHLEPFPALTPPPAIAHPGWKDIRACTWWRWRRYQIRSRVKQQIWRSWFISGQRGYCLRPRAVRDDMV